MRTNASADQRQQGDLAPTRTSGSRRSSIGTGLTMPVADHDEPPASWPRESFPRCSSSAATITMR